MPFFSNFLQKFEMTFSAYSQQIVEWDINFTGHWAEKMLWHPCNKTPHLCHKTRIKKYVDLNMFLYLYVTRFLWNEIVKKKYFPRVITFLKFALYELLKNKTKQNKNILDK